MAESQGQPNISIPDLTPNLNLYDTLGICSNSTEEDIRKAYRQRARQLHPDKNIHSQAREWMQKVNEAYSVLTDRIKRREYDQKLLDDDDAPQGNMISLPDGPKFSAKLKAKMILWETIKWKNVKDIGKFTSFLRDEMTKFSQESMPKLMSQLKKCAALRTHINHFQKMEHLEYTSLVSFDRSPSKRKGKKTDSSNDRIDHLIFTARTAKKRGRKNILTCGELVPIIDFSDASKEDLLLLLGVFEIHKNKSADKSKDLLKLLENFIPHTEVKPLDLPKKRKKDTCVLCNRVTALATDLHCLPRYGLMLPQPVCESCRDENHSQDMNDWTNAGSSYLISDNPNVSAGVGCLYLASCSRPPGPTSLLHDAKDLINTGFPEMVFPLVSAALKAATNPSDAVKAHLISSKALIVMSEEMDDINWFDKCCLLLTAKEAHLSACDASINAEDAFSLEELFDKMKEIEVGISTIISQKEKEWEQCMKTYHIQFEAAWGKREFESIMQILRDERNDDLIAINNSKDYILEALTMFLDSKKSFQDHMLAEDRAHLLFFRGCLNLQRQNCHTGFSLIHLAVLTAPLSSSLRKTAIDLVLHYLPDHSAVTIESIQTALDQLKQSEDPVASCAVETSCMAFLPTVEQLKPPTTKQWSELCTTSGVNFYKYEAAIFKQVEEKSWNELEVAMAYIDLVPACEHSSQVATCFINAALWLLKHLSVVLQNPKERMQNLYVLRKSIIWCSQVAVEIATMSLHPAMQTYIFRLAIALVLQCTKLIPQLATKDESQCLIWWLHKLVYNIRFCPFWDTPTVMVSEALLLHIFSGRLHSEYTVALQDTQGDGCPIQFHELRYHLYENDLKKLQVLDEDDKPKEKAMSALLKRVGLSLDDVSNLLYSPQSPRSKDGWLIQQKTLGTHEEFSSLHGIVINMNSENPSFSLLTVPTDEKKGKVGLFSTTDVNTVLQLDYENLFPLYFSLDPPNIDQHYHPFQEFRFEPQNLAGTPLLHALFETDYLLKSFTVGAEVSSAPPFQQQPTSANLTKDLPFELQELLKPIHERGPSANHINRFWIQADELTYSSEQKGSTVEFLVSEPKMSIRTHPILPGPDGSLRDTEEDNDPNSPEKKFAEELTKKYDLLATYFPMFARLKELVKLQFLVMVMKSTVKDLKDKCNTRVNVPKELLQEIRTRSTKDLVPVLSKIYRDIQTSIQEAIEHNRWNPHSGIRYAIPTNSEITTEVVNGLMHNGSKNMSYSSLKSHVSSWISSGGSSYATQSLASYMSSCQITEQDIMKMIQDEQNKTYRAFNGLMNQLQTAAAQSCRLNSSKIGMTMWVPAALHQEAMGEDAYFLSYGGVLLAPNIKHSKSHLRKVPSQKYQLQPRNLSSAKSVQSRSKSKFTTGWNPSSATSSNKPRHTSERSVGATGTGSVRASKNGKSSLQTTGGGGGSGGTSGGGGGSDGTSGGGGGSDGTSGGGGGSGGTSGGGGGSGGFPGIYSHLCNPITLKSIIQTVFKRTLSTMPGKVEGITAEQRVGNRFLDLVFKTSEGVVINELKTSSKAEFSKSEYFNHMKQLLNYRREYIAAHNEAPTSLRLIALQERGKSTAVHNFEINLNHIPQQVLNAKNEEEFNSAFKAFRRSSQSEFDIIIITIQWNRPKLSTMSLVYLHYTDDE